MIFKTLKGRSHSSNFLPFFVFKLTISAEGVPVKGGVFLKKMKKGNGLILAIIMICTAIIPSLIYGSSLVHNTIRVGLRGNYASVSSVTVKNTELNVGYERNDRFLTEATLQSYTGFVVKPSSKQYYGSEDVFNTYSDAVYALVDYIGEGAVIAYKAPSTWRIYAERDLGNMNLVRSSGLEVVVEDGGGNPLVVCDNGGSAPAFAGESSQQTFHLTELTKGSYRGWFEFIRQGSTMIPVNIVDYEDYLYGVVAAEMPASWNMEALKAQAVAARSMSIHQYNKYIKSGYNVCDTTFTQVYKGFTGEHVRTNQAVDETRGIVATYNGKVAETLFYSTSGGHTEDPQYVWGNPIPYLKAIPDPYETEPEMKPWARIITLADIDICLQKQNINIGRATGLRINAYTPAGRVNELEIVGTAGVHKVVRENIRTFFTYTTEGSLRSRMFTINNGKVPTLPSEPAGSSESIAVYGGGSSPQYLVGADGKVKEVGSAIVVEGPNGKTVYGSSGSSQSSQPGQSAQEQYGDITISGRGYGHGVGMSQSGARGMAKEGYTYDQIIKYYYQGVSLE